MVGVALLLWGLSSQLITLIYGPGFERAAAALHVLSWNVVPFSLTVLLAHVLFAAGRQAADLWVNVIATAVSVTLNCVLIPRYGCLGASWTALLSMLLHVVFQYAFVRGVVQPQVGAQLARIGGAALMAAVATALAGDLALLPKAALLLTAYGAGLLVVGVVTRRDANALRTALAQALPRWGTVEP
jgi:O-antigen/teichoic acid export membrane protein